MPNNSDMPMNRAPKTRGHLIVLSGPSGSGKSTLTRRAVAATGAVLSISATTRAQTGQEVHGRDYFFLTEAEFQERLRRGEFLEHAKVFDHYYGTPKKAVESQLAEGRTVILEIDVQGAMQVFDQMPEALGVFVLPARGDTEAQLAVLKQRLVERARDDAQTIEKRLLEAQREIRMARQCGRYRELINDDLARATDELIAIIRT